MEKTFLPFKKRIHVLLSLILIFSGLTSTHGQFFIDGETGLAGTGYNNVRIPGDGGTAFSLKDDLDPEPLLFYRLRAGYIFNDRHTFSLLYAPLTITSEGRTGFNLIFEGETFSAGTDLTGKYTFNSYRLTYRYDLVRNEKLRFGLGFSAKIRDAKISLESPTEYAEKTNVGFVPIINFRLSWQAADRIGLLFEGDALAAPQGRAEDVLLAATYAFSRKFRLKAGYRILEGGADNDEVYNFALINYAAIGFVFEI